MKQINVYGLKVIFKSRKCVIINGETNFKIKDSKWFCEKIIIVSWSALPAKDTECTGKAY